LHWGTRLVNNGDRREHFKIFYLLALAVALFLTHGFALLVALLALQFVLWFRSGLPARGLLRSTRRLWLFFLVIVLSFAFVSTGGAEHWVAISLAGWTPSVNLAGVALAGLMCLRVLTLVIASAWVQQSSAPGALVRGLQRLRVPESVAVTVDAALAILGSQPARPGSGTGGGKGGGGRHATGGAGGAEAEAERTLSWQDVRQGRVEFLNELVQRGLARARDWLAARYPQLPAQRLGDLSIVLAVCLTVMGLKVLQVLPGIPIASGHKNLLIVPLLLYVSRSTHMRFGGFAAGTAVGIVSFLLGYGKFGILEIAHFAVPGLLADLLLPLARGQSRLRRLVEFAVIGAVLGLGRFAANFLAILLAGSPEVAYLLFAPMLVSQVVFGALSCFVSLILVRPWAPTATGQPPG
jgi:hypothetical protein